MRGHCFDGMNLLVLCILGIGLHAIAKVVHGDPVGCKVTPVRQSHWKTMTCEGVPLDRVLSSLAHPSLGENLVVLLALDCPASAVVELNTSHFETNIFLRSLQIQRCGIQRIADYALETLTNLTEISLDSNQLNHITNATFTGLKSLKLLNLCRNKIMTIKKGTFRDLEKLEWLQLSENDIYTIDDGAFSGLTHLTNLELDHNVQFVPSLHLLSGMKRLKTLQLSGAFIPDYFKKEEERLFFQDQEESLTQLRLVKCYIGNAQLTILKHLKQLLLLDLSGNQLGYVLNGSLPKVKYSLHLEDNNILYIEDGALDVYTEQEHSFLTLDGNPFDCDCNLLGFSSWLRRKIGSVNIKEIDSIKCSGPIPKYGTKVIDHDAHWWQCTQYMPLIALVAVIVLAVLVALIAVIVYCNRVNFKHWLLERRAFSKTEEDTTQDVINERSALVPSGPWMNSLPKGLTGAYLIYNMYQPDILKWVNKHIEEKLYRHPIRVTIQWPAGPDFIPLWKQVREHGFDVRHFLVIVNDDLLLNHWPEMSEKSGLENLAKIVLVLMGKKKKNLPKDLIRLDCPCLEWPEPETYYAGLHRQREQFWKRLRLYLKDLSD